MTTAKIRLDAFIAARDRMTGVDPDIITASDGAILRLSDLHEAAAALTAALATKPDGPRMGGENEWHMLLHPAWPGGLQIFPATREKAIDTLRREWHPDAYLIHKLVFRTDYKGAELDALLNYGAAAPSPAEGES